MANTYTSLNYHLIFSTKNRQQALSHDTESRLWPYIGGVARAHGMTALQVGGVEDHIHALVTAPASISPSKVAQYLKGDSSKWLHEEFPALREVSWQEGYSAFSVSKSNIPAVARYIEYQREHHSRKTFQQEYVAFLKAHDIAYDERYLWG